MSGEILAENIKKLKERYPQGFTEKDASRGGCGNGGLNWNEVKPILERILDDRFIVCDLNGER